MGKGQAKQSLFKKNIVLTLDLDDTLYEEKTFVESGFREVSHFMHKSFSLPMEETFSIMIDKLNSGRGRIFDDCLEKYEIRNKAFIRKCLSIYRSHTPSIRLFAEADNFLHRCQEFPIYIVTDGNPIAQHNKLKSLGLYERVKFCYITSRYGLVHAKPSPYCFMKLCEKEKTIPPYVVYIGDNPHKDFVEIKNLGFKTIRVLTGPYKDTIANPEYEAQYQIQSLADITMKFLKTVFENDAKRIKR